MAEIILFPTHPDYCKRCIFYSPENGACQNKKYIKNQYKVVCVWRYCKYRQERGQNET